MEQGARDKAGALARDLEDALRRINGRTYACIAPTPVALSTMTITARTSATSVCRDSMMIAASLVDGDGPIGLASSKKRKRPMATFYNQVTLRYDTKSVKVFNNGTMHITGCRSPADFVEVASTVCGLMENTAGVAEDVRVLDFQVQMINLNFGVGRELFLQDLRDACAGLGLIASYDSDVYPGLNVKTEVDGQRVTILMFKSGKVIMTGAKTPRHLEEAHRVITAILDNAAKKNVDA